MASLVPGYECDLFISYRQKDNKYDGWVTEFVSNLKKELEATFKEDISIYFDTNPHDGLLETHDVAKSLEGRLKCLIFIPVISQTYCDPNSFAWQHELCAFNRMAKGDTFGREVKLNSGNVASRILPVKIHDLDRDDQVLLEKELGGVLRAIEFIYKESGVNRPLQPTDKRIENQNKTDYRNQVNKTANAIKEIIAALKYPATSQPHREIQLPDKNHFRIRLNKTQLLLLFIGILFAGYLFYSKLSSQSMSSAGSSIAVLPFANKSNDKEQDYFSEGLSDAIRNVLGKVPRLKVSGQASSAFFKGKNEEPASIGKSLGVDHLLDGSVQKSGNKIRVNVQLARATDGIQIWSETYTRNTNEIFDLQDEIASAVVEKLKLILETNPARDHLPYGTTNIDAYDQFLRGLKMYYLAHVDFDDAQLATANEFFEKATALDPAFGYPYHFMSDLYVHQIEYENLDAPTRENIYLKMHEYMDKAIQLSDDSTRTKLLKVEKNLMSDNWSNLTESLDTFLKDPRAANIASETGIGVTALAFILLNRGSELAALSEEALRIDPLNPILWQFGAVGLSEEDPKKAYAFLVKGETLLKTRFRTHDQYESMAHGKSEQNFHSRLKPERIQAIDKMAHGHLIFVDQMFSGAVIDLTLAPNFAAHMKELK